MRNTEKLKKTTGEIISVSVCPDVPSDFAKNYSVFARFDSRTGTHNMCKEFRDITRAGAVSHALNELNGCHRAQTRTIQIMAVNELENEQVTKNKVSQYHSDDLKFPVTFQNQLVPKSAARRFVRK
eukprot:GHVH01011826.1.p1 GENE.GHVH01011826.1~~GHVH01011826.1.p1  ORF type:complete len:126 (-),score=20.85 GHVH01011826.1:35-412(-)